VRGTGGSDPREGPQRPGSSIRTGRRPPAPGQAAGRGPLAPDGPGEGPQSPQDARGAGRVLPVGERPPGGRVPPARAPTAERHHLQHTPALTPVPRGGPMLPRTKRVLLALAVASLGARAPAGARTPPAVGG